MIISKESPCLEKMFTCVSLPGKLILTCLMIFLVFPLSAVARDARYSILPDHIEAKLSSLVRTRVEEVSPGEKAVFWVFFEDKGIPDVEERRQTLARIEEDLPLRTLERRAVRGCRSGIVDELDIPVCSRYMEEIGLLDVKHRATSRWLNAISIECGYSEIVRCAALDFVKRIDIVHPTSRKTVVVDPVNEFLKFRKISIDSTEYGWSYDQLRQLNIPEVHAMGIDGDGILICMLDTGYQRDIHPAIEAQAVEYEWDFINDDDDTSYDPSQDDPYQPFHGSITMCTVGGYEPDKYIAPAYGAHFLLAKTEDITDEQPVEEDWWVEGIEWAESLGADVTSSSLGYTEWYEYRDLDGNTAVTTIAADIAVSLGVVVVTAAGNERTNDWHYIVCPADADSVIAAGAVDSLGFLADFSSAGPTYDGRIKPEVCARGVNTWCAHPFDTSDYIQVSGTSLSTPLVAGAAALVLQAHPDWSPVAVRQALMETADNASSPDNDYGWGVIDVMAAIRWTGRGYCDDEASFREAVNDR